MTQDIRRVVCNHVDAPNLPLGSTCTTQIFHNLRRNKTHMCLDLLKAAFDSPNENFPTNLLKNILLPVYAARGFACHGSGARFSAHTCHCHFVSYRNCNSLESRILLAHTFPTWTCLWHLSVCGLQLCAPRGFRPAFFRAHACIPGTALLKSNFLAKSAQSKTLLM